MLLTVLARVFGDYTASAVGGLFAKLTSVVPGLPVESQDRDTSKCEGYLLLAKLEEYLTTPKHTNSYQLHTLVHPDLVPTTGGLPRCTRRGSNKRQNVRAKPSLAPSLRHAHLELS